MIANQMDAEKHHFAFHQLAKHLYFYANEQCKSQNETPQPDYKSGSNGLFSMQICYNEDADGVLTTLGGEPRFNGNISATAWKGPDCINHGYTYEYDDFRRLTAANYKGGNSTVGWGSTDYYSMTADYDLDGNITHLMRSGIAQYGTINSSFQACEPVMVYPGGYGTIDNLTYTYSSENNTLYKVTDAIPHIDHGNDFSGPATYSYSNGNLIGDSGKGMTINYNHLEQPKKFTIEEGEIELTYDALGNKLQKRIYDVGFIPGTYPNCVTKNQMGQKDYLLDFLYRRYYPETKNLNSTEPKSRAHRFYHQEGSIEWRRIDDIDDENGESGQGTWNPTYQYTIKDHLGNGRVYFTEDYDEDGLLDVLQESHYYPFGMKIDGISRLYDSPGDVLFSNHGYMYPEDPITGATSFMEYLQYTHDLKRYNGKEFNREFGLNWYDYGARWYDPAIGRWNAVDPLADEPHNLPLNPYHFVNNNPINNIDPDGLDWYSYTDEDGNETVIYVDSDEDTYTSNSGATYQNIGTTYSHYLLDGTHVTYEQDEIVNVVEPGFDGDAYTDIKTVKEVFGKEFSIKFESFDRDDQNLMELIYKVANWFSVSPGEDLQRIEDQGSSIFGPRGVNVSPKLGAKRGGRNRKGERNKTSKASGTNNPFKKMKPDPKNPNKVIIKDANGKQKSVKKPQGFDAYWKSKH